MACDDIVDLKGDLGSYQGYLQGGLIFGKPAQGTAARTLVTQLLQFLDSTATPDVNAAYDLASSCQTATSSNHEVVAKVFFSPLWSRAETEIALILYRTRLRFAPRSTSWLAMLRTS